jgi:CDP-paratose 2-epimerase
VISYWVYAALLKRPLQYIGFGGRGKQVRDCVLADDVADLVSTQIKNPGRKGPRRLNIGGGRSSAVSLCELTRLCEDSFGYRMKVGKTLENRPYDIPYFATDARKAKQMWGWRPSRTAEQIALDLCRWASDHREWVETICA